MFWASKQSTSCQEHAVLLSSPETLLNIISNGKSEHKRCSCAYAREYWLLTQLQAADYLAMTTSSCCCSFIISYSSSRPVACTSMLLTTPSMTYALTAAMASARTDALTKSRSRACC